MFVGVYLLSYVLCKGTYPILCLVLTFKQNKTESILQPLTSNNLGCKGEEKTKKLPPSINYTQLSSLDKINNLATREFSTNEKIPFSNVLF